MENGRAAANGLTGGLDLRNLVDSKKAVVLISEIVPVAVP